MRARRRSLLTIPLTLVAALFTACEQDPAPLGPTVRLMAAKLGTNGRSCATCHLASDAFSLTPASAQARFAATGGTDPLFAAVDGASLLLGNGLIRVALPVPAAAQYSLEVVHDPYGCALTAGAGGAPTVSLYRRPLPSTNLRFLSAVVFDGRETVQPLASPGTFLANLRADLAHQAMDATLGHAQAAAAPSEAQITRIVDLEVLPQRRGGEPRLTQPEKADLVAFLKSL